MVDGAVVDLVDVVVCIVDKLTLSFIVYLVAGFFLDVVVDLVDLVVEIIADVDSVVLLNVAVDADVVVNWTLTSCRR